MITLSSNGPFASNSFFRPKTIFKVAIIKTESATNAFFSSPPFLLLALSFFRFSFVTVTAKNTYLSTKGRSSLITYVQLILTRVFEMSEDLINFVEWRLKRRTKGFNEGPSISFALGSNKGRLGSSFCKHKKSMF